MNILTPLQFQELHAALLAAFDEADLPMLVRFHYPPAFGKSIDWQKPLDAVATQLLGELEQRGDLEPLIRGMLQARPKKEEVVRFCRSHFPQAFQAPGQADLVSRVTGGLTALIGALSNPEVRLRMGRFQADIDTARDRIRTLAAYKVLHDSLHNLEQRLGTIADAAGKFRQDPVAPLQLRRAAIDLRREARRSREAANGTPTRELELFWVEELEQAVATMQAALEAGDEGPMTRTVETLRGLVSQATRINGQLCLVAADMRLGALIAALTEIDKRMPGAGAADGPALRLRAGLEGLKGLQAEFARRVAEHQEWQWLDRHLRATDGSPEHEPAKKVPRWAEVRERLGRLCDLFASEEWYVELRAQRDRWERVAAGGDRVVSTVEADTFRALASNCFFDVDGELNALCERLNEVSILLDTLLEVLADDRA